MLENKIYSRWAFTENEKEKSKINREIYKNLKEKYRVYRHDLKIDIVDGVDVDFNDYDIIIGRKPGYHHSNYKVIKNEPKLSNEELALICDSGNLCFGYRYEGNHSFYVFPHICIQSISFHCNK